MVRNSPRDRSTKTESHYWLALILLCTTQFMVILDFSIVNIALPSMQRSLGFSQENLQWVISAYALAIGSFLMLGGRAADLLGRRRVFIAGLGLFVLASFVGGCAQSQWVLIVARAFQGLGAAIVSPAALSILTITFPEGAERNRALAIWGVMAAGGFTAGVLLGGILTDWLTWRSVMFVNVPIGLVAIALSPLLLKESQSSVVGEQIDLAGAVSMTGGLALLVYTLVHASEAGLFALSSLVLLLGAVVLLALFVWIESRAIAPLIPLRIFHQSTLIGASGVASLLSASAASMVFILTLYMQQILHYSALQTGLAFLPHALAATIAAPLASRLVNQFGMKFTLVTGMVALMIGLILLTRIPLQGDFVRDLLPGTAIVGLGIATGLVSATIAATTGVANQEQGLASGILNTAQEIGSALGLAILVAVATARTHTIAMSIDKLVTVPDALVGGFQAALSVGVGFAAIGILVAVLILHERTF